MTSSGSQVKSVFSKGETAMMVSSPDIAKGLWPILHIRSRRRRLSLVRTHSTSVGANGHSTVSIALSPLLEARPRRAGKVGPPEAMAHSWDVSEVQR